MHQTAQQQSHCYSTGAHETGRVERTKSEA